MKRNVRRLITILLMAASILVTTHPVWSATDNTRTFAMGYWANWALGSSGFDMKLRDIDDRYDIIFVAFAEGDSNAYLTFTPESTLYSSPEDFVSDVDYLRSQGKKVVISVGGAAGSFPLETTEQKDELIRSLKEIIDFYHFDGFDVDLEGGRISLDVGDTDLQNPTTPTIVNWIDTIREIHSYMESRGTDPIITLTPEAAYVQGGLAAYSGIWGAYLPVIHQTRDMITSVNVQYYNTAGLPALDGKLYTPHIDNPDFMVAMTDMMIEGFQPPGSVTPFPGLREDQVGFGYPVWDGTPIPTFDCVKKALDYIVTGQSFGGEYVLLNPDGYLNFSGVFHWNINWDKEKYDFGYISQLRPLIDSFNQISRQCSDGLDNDGDGLVDTEDTGCESSGDDQEYNAPMQCSDGLDNDGDGSVDTADPDCEGPEDNLEGSEPILAWNGNGVPYAVGDLVTYQGNVYRCTWAHTSAPNWDPIHAWYAWEESAETPPATQCSDGVDNDGDGLVDMDDPGCESETDDNEYDCTSDGDCSDGLFCNGQETCSGGACQAGTAVNCEDGVSCTVDSCNEATDSCDNLPTDALCDDGLFCNGAETCDATADCQAGVEPCVSPMICNEESDVCEESPVYACSDGIDNDGDGLVDMDDPHCDSPEDISESEEDTSIPAWDGNGVYYDVGDLVVYQTKVYRCVWGHTSAPNWDPIHAWYAWEESAETPPATQCSDGVDNDGDGLVDMDDPGCESETDDNEYDCTSDGDCSDGLFCNGQETCSGGACQAGTAVNCEDGVSCTVDSCNEATDSCDNLPTDALCDDDLFCNGAETCDAATGCQTGVDPCTSTGTCNEGTDTCEDDVDGIEIGFSKTSDWGDGYVASIRIVNNTQTTLDGWTLEFDLEPTISSLWSGVWSADNDHHTVDNAAWNGTLAPGGAAEFGFTGAYAGTFTEPYNCILNGEPCTFNGDGDAGPNPVPSADIQIEEVDEEEIALQVTVDNGATVQYTLKAAGIDQAEFDVSTNNPSVLDCGVIGDSGLVLTALASGRASLKIMEKTSDMVRFLGVRIRTPQGDLPGMPNYLAVGSVSEDTDADLDFWKEFGAGDLNRRMDIRYIYLCGGPFNGWRTWSSEDGGRVTSYVRESLKLGMIPFFVYYNIPEGEESYWTDMDHIQSAEYMQAYYKDLKFALDKINDAAGDELVGIVLEPDFLGYMMQQSGLRPDEISAQVGAAYDTGVLSTDEDPVFPNTVEGLVKSINYIILKHTNNPYFGWQFNLWASPGIVTPITSTGLIHLTETMGIEAGRAAIRAETREIAAYYVDAGVLSYEADFVSIDKYGLDAGAENGAAQNPAASTWFWNSDHWQNYLSFSQTLNEETGLPVVLWQIPVGHINSSLSTNPYTGGLFPDHQNISTDYEDSAPSFFFGDVFETDGLRLEHFGTNEGDDPKVSSVGNRITWGSHMEDTANAGVQAVLFGAGVGDSTDGVGSPPTDGYWWITQAQRYFEALP